jgi:hypothetical protein
MLFSGFIFQFFDLPVQDKQIACDAQPYDQIDTHDKAQTVFHFSSPICGLLFISSEFENKKKPRKQKKTTKARKKDQSTTLLISNRGFAKFSNKPHENKKKPRTDFKAQPQSTKARKHKNIISLCGRRQNTPGMPGGICQRF